MVVCQLFLPRQQIASARLAHHMVLHANVRPAHHTKLIANALRALVAIRQIVHAQTAPAVSQDANQDAVAQTALKPKFQVEDKRF